MAEKGKEWDEVTRNKFMNLGHMCTHMYIHTNPIKSHMLIMTSNIITSHFKEVKPI